VIGLRLITSHEPAIQKTISYTFIGFESSVMDWRLVEYGEMGVNRIFLYSALQLLLMPW
jgi:hypothetical protein